MLIEIRDGKTLRWKDLEGVWGPLDGEEEFIKYVQEELDAFIKGTTW